MALQGTIKDFGLGDIFQLIGMQRKTGVLTLSNDDDTVTVHFYEGSIVSANTRLRNLEDLLGGVLVRTGRITDAELVHALGIQKKTLQRLGYILVKEGILSEAELGDALQAQVTQIIYRLFRWQDGQYSFTATEHIDYDKEHFVPVSAETVLMEGARMIDEWPMIERKIRSEMMVFRRADPDQAVEGAAELTRSEKTVLSLVDGEATVQGIVDRSGWGEFDVHRALYELLNRRLIEEVPAEASDDDPLPRAEGISWASRLAQVAVVGLALVSVFTLARNPLTPWRVALDGEPSDRLKAYTSRSRVERVDRALRVFFMDAGSVPERLDPLARAGYVGEADLIDPWGRLYDLRVDPGGYRLIGLDAEGAVDDSLSPSRRFTSVERVLLGGLDSGIAPSP